MLIDDIKDNVKNLSLKLPSLKIDSIFVEENGKLDKIFYNNETLHELRSCSKLLVSLAIGIAIDKNMLVFGVPLSLETKIYPSIKNVINVTKSENLSKIKKWTIKDLLLHSTGYEKQMMSENYIKENNVDTSNMLNYALNYDIPYEVGNRFAYNNLEPFILSVFFQETFNINLSDFIAENIFNKLDIKEYKWDNYGKYCPGATGLYLKHTDFHKIGKLLLENGKYNNIQVVSSNWINTISSLKIKTPSIYKPERVFPKIGVGYFIFISRDGFIFRDGAEGQYILLNKEKNLLITIMSSEKDMKNILEILRGLI